MSTTTPAMTYDPPIIGTGGNQLLAVETSISFQWVPASGNAWVEHDDWLNYTDTGMDWQTSDTTGPGTATGTVTFNGVSSSEPFQSTPTAISFGFSNGWSISLPSWDLGNVYDPGWTFDPATGMLDPQGSYASGDDWIGVGFQANETDLTTAHWSGNTSDQDTGHWQLVPQIHNVDVIAGQGNDTILGGQGTERLFGGTGNDLIRAGIGADLVYGGDGNDEIHGGLGQQTLMGGAGDDTIWGGSGAQLLLGGDGRDMLHAGSGPQTLMGGAGNDALWGGSGDQSLEGGDGNDILHAGSGNETLSGGAGKDMFVFFTPVGHAVITDFQPHQDIIEIGFGSAGPNFVRPRDLMPAISADAHGDAVIAIGGDFRLVLQHVSTQQVRADPASFFKLG